MELQMSRVNGTPLIVEGKGVRTFIGGEFAIQVAIRDITERRLAEEVTENRKIASSSHFSAMFQRFCFTYQWKRTTVTVS